MVIKMSLIEIVLVTASLGGAAVLIARAVHCTKCTELRELPEKPIKMEHEHGGEDNV